MFAWLHATALAETIRESSYLFPWIESIHVLALTLVVGSISIVDLRLLGIASRDRSAAQLMAEVLPFTWTAFIVALLSGGTLFTSHAVGYAQNFQFRMKMLLLALAGINMLVFHLFTGRHAARWSQDHPIPWQARLAAGISLTLWIGIVAFGRWIGFTNVQ
ncbi:MAG TPA: DUF6644 family protein [Steroidobacteraceae bacterium]|jgi:hypothetical protein|nr:DUF6644 family protein [Steroidobacteraceae bacterium]